MPDERKRDGQGADAEAEQAEFERRAIGLADLSAAFEVGCTADRIVKSML